MKGIIMFTYEDIQAINRIAESIENLASAVRSTNDVVMPKTKDELIIQLATSGTKHLDADDLLETADVIWERISDD